MTRVDLGEIDGLVEIGSRRLPGAHPQIENISVTVYANSGRPISGEIIRSVVQGITNQILTGNIAIAATFSELEATTAPGAVGQAASTIDLGSAFACAFTPASNTIRLDPLAVGGSTAVRENSVCVPAVVDSVPGPDATCHT